MVKKIIKEVKKPTKAQQVGANKAEEDAQNKKINDLVAGGMDQEDAIKAASK